MTDQESENPIWVDVDSGFTGEPEQKCELFAALAKAQGEFGEVIKTAKGRKGHQEYFYANLATLIAASRPALTRHGLAVIQPFSGGLSQGVGRIETRLLHGSGASMWSVLSFTPQGDIKDLGSQVTYLRRYAYNALLGLDGDQDADEMAGPTDSGANQNLPPTQQPTAKKPSTSQPKTDKQLLSSLLKSVVKDFKKEDKREVVDRIAKHVCGVSYADVSDEHTLKLTAALQEAVDQDAVSTLLVKAGVLEEAEVNNE